MTVTSDEYEQFVQNVCTALVGVTVHRQKVYTGRVSRRDIKVDVSFNYSIMGSDVLFLVECKCYNHRVPVDDVEEFHSKIDDIGAHKGIMITTKGFQDGAIKTAEGRGIALALLTTEQQPGEIAYVVNSAGAPPMRREHGGFWQGNIRGPLGNYGGGLRFDSMGQILGMFIVDHMASKR
jgi:hypothetical protein